MKSGAEVLKNYCFVDENEKIDNHSKTYYNGMITGLYLNNIITASEEHAAKEILKAMWAGMHPQFASFFETK